MTARDPLSFFATAAAARHSDVQTRFPEGGGDMTLVPVRCCICGDVQIESREMRLIAEGSSVDYSFTHCDTETRRHATPDQVRVALALGVQVIHPPRPAAHCHSCGVHRFELGGGVLACRNCDAPTPGLPPADKERAR